MNDKVEKLVEWVAGEISKEAHHGTIIKDIFPSEWERDLRRAKKILSHPDLALIDKSQMVISTVAKPKVIPLAEALGEVEDDR